MQQDGNTTEEAAAGVDPWLGPPLTARSVVASLLLGLRRPRSPGRRLVRAAELFGFTEGTTRVALSRMVAAGELTSSAGHYELAGPLLERYGRQEEGRRPAMRPWDGSWRLAVVGSGGGRRPPSERAALRRQLATLRLGEWREGVWIRPDNLVTRWARLPGCTWVVAAQPEEGAFDELVSTLWPLAAWSARANDLRGAMAAMLPRLAVAGPDLVPVAFRLAAAAVRHMRDDALLPPELLPADWPGAVLRADYDGFEAALQAALRPTLLGET